MKASQSLAPGVSRVLFACAALAAWEIIAAVANNPHAFPSSWYLFRESYPSFAIFGNASTNDYLEASRTLLRHAGITATRVVVGLALGLLSGIPVGLFAHVITSARRATRFLIVAAANVPLFSLVPLFLYWFSGSELGILLYIAVAVSTLMALATYEAASNVPVRYMWRSALAGASPTGRLWTVMLPAITPELLVTVRWLLGIAWAFSLGAEYLSSRASGCGFLAYQSYLYSDVGKLIVLAVVYAAMGAFSLLAFDLGHRFLSPRLGPVGVNGGT